MKYVVPTLGILVGLVVIANLYVFLEEALPGWGFLFSPGLLWFALLIFLVHYGCSRCTCSPNGTAMFADGPLWRYAVSATLAVVVFMTLLIPLVMIAISYFEQLLLERFDTIIFSDILGIFLVVSLIGGLVGTEWLVAKYSISKRLKNLRALLTPIMVSYIFITVVGFFAMVASTVDK